MINIAFYQFIAMYYLYSITSITYYIVHFRLTSLSIELSFIFALNHIVLFTHRSLTQSHNTLEARPHTSLTFSFVFLALVADQQPIQLIEFEIEYFAIMENAFHNLMTL